MSAGIAVAVIAAVVLGGWWYVNYRDQQAQSELSAAIEKYNAPIRPAGQPAMPGELSFASAQERAKATNAEFTRIADKYGFTQSGRMARYFAGITCHEMGDNTNAEKALQMVAGSRSKEIASLAKLALAGHLSRHQPRSAGHRAVQGPGRASHRLGRQEHGAVPAGVAVRGEPPARPGARPLSADAKGKPCQPRGPARRAEAADARQQ